jgi:DNA modification methylase
MPTAPSLAALLGSDDQKYRQPRDFFDDESEVSPVAEDLLQVGKNEVRRFVGEFWTSGQRQASSLHEVSYRACFKPQLPHYFIKRFTKEGDTVYDPFGGRGTTAVEAALMERRVISNDANPLARILLGPRLCPPSLMEVEKRLEAIKYRKGLKADIDLSMFYDSETESEIVSLKRYLQDKNESGQEDIADAWIRMVATNRLTGHSPGFFSVYTFPPNQAVSPESQKKINVRRKQKPEYRDTKDLILRKSRSLLSKVTTEQRANLQRVYQYAQLLTEDARSIRAIKSKSVQLTVTSPPFLDIVEYAGDNWLRCWFNEIDVDAVAKTITMAKSIGDWTRAMGGVLKELYRVTKPGGWVAFEVGEIRNATLKLEEHVMPLGIDAGFSCEAVLINQQTFTKTSNIWGVKNNEAGTNSNRIALFKCG